MEPYVKMWKKLKGVDLGGIPIESLEPIPNVERAPGFVIQEEPNSKYPHGLKAWNRYHGEVTLFKTVSQIVDAHFGQERFFEKTFQEARLLDKQEELIDALKKVFGSSLGMEIYNAQSFDGSVEAVLEKLARFKEKKSAGLETNAIGN